MVFRVKTKIYKGNVRKLFFQAVANSSWANFAYLVAAEAIDNETYKEIEMLANLHGVGFIKLEKNDIPESKILIQAKERKEIDWKAFARLAESNQDFNNNFVKEVDNLLLDSRRKFDLKKWGLEEVVSD